MHERQVYAMKVVFISNYFNHHQAPFSEAMNKLTNGNYWFVAVEEMSEERKNMGWEHDDLPDYVIKSYKSKESLDYAKRKIDEADTVIFGLSGWKNFKLIQKRLSQKKLTFRYSERIYKEGFKWHRFPIQALKHWLVGGRCSCLYMLCASAYTAQDYAKTGCYLNRTYEWGYFPKIKRYDIDEMMGKKLSARSAGWKHPCASILWAGRLIGWKHPDVSIRLAAALKEKGYSFKMSIIGNGEMEQQLHDMICDKNLDDCMEMLGAMSPDEVRKHMEGADIYLFTSDFNEGWGAVLNESMNSGCAVVASHAIGAVPFLIKDTVNGLVYQNGDECHLEMQVRRLLDDKNYRDQIGREAYKTIINMWNADNAANRFLMLAKSLQKGNGADLFDDGPCSKAQSIKNNWFTC